jgi:hypothetical protein
MHADPRGFSRIGISWKHARLLILEHQSENENTELFTVPGGPDFERVKKSPKTLVAKRKQDFWRFS